MSLKKTHKRKKYSRMHGRGMGTAGHGARKQHRSSGNRGGRGLSGTGKRADHKKTWVTAMYGHGYFGKQGITSRGTKRDKRKRINLRDVNRIIENLKKEKLEIDLHEYKILGEGEIGKGVIIKAKEASSSAIDKVKKVGGKIVLSEKKEKEDKKTKS